MTDPIPANVQGRENAKARIHPGPVHARRQVLRKLYEALARTIDSPLLPAGETVLDYGCGNKPYEALFRKKFPRYVAADLESNPAAAVRVVDAGHLPVGARSVDCVFSSQVLEHVKDPAAYLAEARRVLKSGGSLLLSTHGIWRYHPDPADYRRWTREGLELELVRAGFEMQRCEGVFGLASSGLQLIQDAVIGRLPRFARSAWAWMIQSLIGGIERFRDPRHSDDACIYVVLARKTGEENL